MANAAPHGVSIQFCKTKMCRFELMGMCTKGIECLFAHGVTELKALPDLRCTKLCKQHVETGECTNPVCTYAHSKAELRLAAQRLAAARSQKAQKGKQSMGDRPVQPSSQHAHHPRGLVNQDGTTAAAQNSSEPSNSFRPRLHPAPRVTGTAVTTGDVVTPEAAKTHAELIKWFALTASVGTSFHFQEQCKFWAAGSSAFGNASLPEQFASFTMGSCKPAEPAYVSTSLPGLQHDWLDVPVGVPDFHSSDQIRSAAPAQSRAVARELPPVAAFGMWNPWSPSALGSYISPVASLGGADVQRTASVPGTAPGPAAPSGLMHDRNSLDSPYLPSSSQVWARPAGSRAIGVQL